LVRTQPRSAPYPSGSVTVQFHFSTVVWGPSHTSVFVDLNLPSLLAPNNLPAFVARHKVLYRIFTSSADVERISASPAFRRAQQFATFEFIEAIKEHPAQPIARHHELWRQSAATAGAKGAMVLFIAPDVVWSNGSLRHVGEIVEKGKRVIFMSHLRVTEESCLPILRKLNGGPQHPVIDMSSRDMVALALRHIHPLAITYLRGSRNFPVHPEFILWPVGSEGLLMRVLVRELFAYDPALIDLNEQSLVAHALDPQVTHVIADSDDVFSLSLTPGLQDVEWYMKPQPLEPMKIASWWLSYDSPVNDMVVARHFRIHSGSRTPALWRAAERQSDILIQKLAGLREVLRVLIAMGYPEASQARRVVALALGTTRLGQMVRGPRRRLTLLLPNNRAVVRWLISGGDDILRPERRRALVDLILDHVIEEDPSFKPNSHGTVTTLGGRRRKLARVDDALQIDGVRVQEPALDVGPHRAYVVDAVLPRATPARP
jgi:Fasciclin domain